MSIHRNPRPSTGRIQLSVTVPDDVELGWHRSDGEEVAVVSIECAGYAQLSLHLTDAGLRNLVEQLNVAYLHLFAEAPECLYCGAAHLSGPCQVVGAQA